MNENRIQQVLEIEKQAQEIHEVALRDAQQLPILAEQESQVVMEKARAGAQEEARQLVANAQAKVLQQHGLLRHFFDRESFGMSAASRQEAQPAGAC